MTIVQDAPPMPNVLQSLKNLNTVLPNATSSELEFLSEEFSADGPPASSPDNLEARIVKINTNTNQNLIVVTQDKVLLCLKRNIARLGKNDWLAPLSTVTTIMLALLTSDFRSALGLGPAEWKAMFVISGFISTGWLAFTMKRSIRSKTLNEVLYDTVHQLGGRVGSFSSAMQD